MSWLFYFPELSSKDEESVQIKNIVIRQLDETSIQLDADLYKKLYEVIDNEFVQKRQTQIIMTTSGLDKISWDEVLGDKYPLGNSKL